MKCLRWNRFYPRTCPEQIHQNLPIRCRSLLARYLAEKQFQSLSFSHDDASLFPFRIESEKGKIVSSVTDFENVRWPASSTLPNNTRIADSNRHLKLKSLKQLFQRSDKTMNTICHGVESDEICVSVMNEKGNYEFCLRVISHSIGSEILLHEEACHRYDGQQPSEGEEVDARDSYFESVTNFQLT